MAEIAIVGTLYSTFCAFLVFPHLGAPTSLSRMALALCALEFVFAVGWSVAHQHCGGMTSGDAVFNKPCPAISGVFASAGAILTVAYFAASIAYGLRAARRWRSTSAS